MKRGGAHRVRCPRGPRNARRGAGAAGRERPRLSGPGARELGKSTVVKALARADVGVTAHGFRSGFKDWARREGIDELLSEFALAHMEGSRTVAAYARDDLGEATPVTQAWCEFACPSNS